MGKGLKSKGLWMIGLVVPVLALGLLCAGTAWAGGPSSGGRGPGFKMMEKHRAMLVKDLDLNEQQQADLDGIHELIKSKHEAHAAERGQHFEMVLDAVEAGDIDDQAVHDHIDARLDEMRVSMHEIADEVIAFVRGLDDEQRTTLVIKLEGFRDKMERFHGGEGPFPGPCGGPHGGH